MNKPPGIAEPPAQGEDIRCFIIMPFGKKFEPVLKAIRDAVEELADKRAYRADDVFQPGAFIDAVKAHIENADFCVVDLTGSNPNVTWEAGYAHALGKPLIPISQQVNKLPANIAGNSTISYEADKLPILRGNLQKAVRVVVAGLRKKVRVPGPPYDDLKEIGQRLQTRLVGRKGQTQVSVLSVLLDSLKQAEGVDWQRGDEITLMEAVEASSTPARAENVFWWLVVHGIFSYDQIEVFHGASDRWRENIDLVHLSRRGCEFLKRIKPAL